jgi:chitodextrinase
MRWILGPAALTSAALVMVTACGDQDSTAPSAPAGVTVHAGSSTSVHVMWNRSADNVGVARYEVYQAGEKVKEVPGEQYMVDIAGLKPSAAYTFTVRARDAAGNLSPASRETSVTMRPATAEDRQPPTRPGDLRGRAEGARAATLVWRKSTDTVGVASYDIYQGDSKIHSVGGGETRALVTGLRPGTAYTFTVKARDAGDNLSPPSRAVDITTASASGRAAGTAPSDFRVKPRAAAGGHYLDLSWIPPKTGGEVREYQIYLNGRFATTLVWGGKAPGSPARHSVYGGEKPDATYSVKIRAKLPDGNWGSFSAERTVTTGRRS